MTDERLDELKADLDKAVSQRNELKQVIETDLAQAQKHAAEVQRLNAKRKNESAPAWQQLTEKVADLTAEIQAEENRRAEEARKAEEQAAE